MRRCILFFLLAVMIPINILAAKPEVHDVIKGTSHCYHNYTSYEKAEAYIYISGWGVSDYFRIEEELDNFEACQELVSETSEMIDDSGCSRSQIEVYHNEWTDGVRFQFVCVGTHNAIVKVIADLSTLVIQH